MTESNHTESKDKAGTVYFIVGLALSLVIWGLQLAGVAVNAILGGIVLLLAFVLMAYAFWTWERTSRWHVLLRIGTVAIAAFVYVVLAGRPVIAEWRREHLEAARGDVHHEQCTD